MQLGFSLASLALAAGSWASFLARLAAQIPISAHLIAACKDLEGFYFQI